MNKKEKAAPGLLKTSTAAIIAFGTFAFGFLAGVAYTVYMTQSQPNQVMTQQVQQNAAPMIAQLKTRVKQNPDDTAAWIQLGHLYFDNDAYSDAIDAYKTALRLDPDNTNVMTDLGIMYRRSRNPQKAVDIFSQVIAIDPKHQNARFNKGIVLLHDLQDRQGAIAAWEGLLEINPLATAPNGQSVDQLVQHYKAHVDK